MKISQAAKELGISVWWILNLEKRGYFPRKITRDRNKNRRFLKEDLDMIRRVVYPEKYVETRKTKESQERDLIPWPDL